jgi:hypothetical protein
MQQQKLIITIIENPTITTSITLRKLRRIHVQNEKKSFYQSLPSAVPLFFHSLTPDSDLQYYNRYITLYLLVI